jgi:hypothetical protein
MKILDEIIKRVHNLTQDQQIEVLKNIQSLQEGEKRRYQRLTIDTEIAAVIDNSVLQSSTRDLSAGGVYIRTTGKYETDKDARVVFTVPGHGTPFKLEGETARTDQSGVAIKFEDRSPYSNRILDDAIWKTKTV